MSADSLLMSDKAFYSYRHPLQKRRFFLALVFSTLLFPLIALGLLAGTVVLIVPFVALLLWIGMRIYFARQIGNAILVSEVNYPRINTIAEQLKVQMGYQKRVYIFVVEMSSFNTFLQMLFFRRAIFLTSEILEAGVSDDEARWLVGRFIGYMRARHQSGALGWIIRAAQKLLVFNLFILPYERAMVYTGDRLALAAIGGDISTATSAMQKLFVGRQLGYSLNPEGILAQQREIKGTFFGFLSRLVASFPHMTARYVDLIDFAKGFFPEQYAKFAAANPGVPADLSLWVAGPRSTPDKPARSGMATGWVLVTAVFAGMLVGGVGLWKSIQAHRGAITEAFAAATAPPTSGNPEQVASADIPEHAHLSAAGRLEPDPGCHWVSNDPKDFRVACNDTGNASEATAAATPASNNAEQLASAEIPEHAHLTADGKLEADPGCQWASNDPKDFRVVCNDQ